MSQDSQREDKWLYAICCTPCLCAFFFGLHYLISSTQEQTAFKGTEWQNKSISNESMLESVALTPFECHKIDIYFFHISPLFLEVKAPKYAGMKLTLQEENTTDSQIIDKCFAQANETCSMSIGGYDEIYGFLSLVDSDNSVEDSVVQWSCLYLNVSLLVILLILTCCSCIGVIFCLSACICLTVKRFRNSSDMNQTSESYHKLTSKPRKWSPSFLSNKAETQPLLKNVKFADTTY